MSNYIDADKLKVKIDNLESFSCISEEQNGFYSAISRINDIIDSLQQEQPQVADASKMEQPDMNIEWFRLAEDYTMHLDFSYCKTCDWMLHIWKKGCGANGEDLIIFNEQDINPNLLLAKGENALKKWLLDNNINAALTPR